MHDTTQNFCLPVILANMAAVVALLVLSSSAPPPLPSRVPFRGLAGLAGKRAPDAVVVDGANNTLHVFSHSFEHAHPDHGVTRLHYNVTVPTHDHATNPVVDLHARNARVLCESGGDLLVRFGGGGAAPPALAAHMGWPTWAQRAAVVVGDCDAADAVGDRPPVAFLRRVLAASVVATAGGGGGGTGGGWLELRLRTVEAEPQDCFQDAEVRFEHEPPFHAHRGGPYEAAHQRALLLERLRAGAAAEDARLQRRRRLLDLESALRRCASGSSISWTGDVSVSCELDVRHLFGDYANYFAFNYDALQRRASEPRLELATSSDNAAAAFFDASCRECVAALDLRLSLNMGIKTFKLQSFRVALTGQAAAQAEVSVSNPAEGALGLLAQQMQALGLGGCLDALTFTVGYVPVRVRPCWELKSAVETSAPRAGLALLAGVALNASALLGVEYVPPAANVPDSAGRWRPLTQWQWRVAHVTPRFALSGGASGAAARAAAAAASGSAELWSARVSMIPAITMSLYDTVMKAELQPRAYVGVSLAAPTPPPAAAGAARARGLAAAPAAQRSAAYGQWEVTVKAGRGLPKVSLLNSILRLGTDTTPDPYVKVQLNGCLGGSGGAAGGALNAHAGWERQRLPCEASTPFLRDSTSPDWNAKLAFSAARTQPAEAALDETMVVSVFDYDQSSRLFDADREWWDADDKDDKLGSATLSCVGAVEHGRVCDQTLTFGTSGRASHFEKGSFTVTVSVRWSQEAVPVDAEEEGVEVRYPRGCWREEGVGECATRRRLEASSSSAAPWAGAASDGGGVRGAAAARRLADASSCSGADSAWAKTFYGADIFADVSQVSLPWKKDAKYAAAESGGSSFAGKKAAPGGNAGVGVLVPLTELGCRRCRGCLSSVVASTAAEGAYYSTRQVPHPKRAAPAGGSLLSGYDHFDANAASSQRRMAASDGTVDEGWVLPTDPGQRARTSKAAFTYDPAAPFGSASSGPCPCSHSSVF